MNVDVLKNITSEDGRIDLDRVQNTVSTNGIAATAWYTDGWYILPEDNLCLLKNMISFKGEYARENSKFQPEEYNAMVCQALAELFKLPSAKYFMAKRKGKEYMLTPNFLEDGEELIHLARIVEVVTGQEQQTTAIQGSKTKISDMHRYLEQFLRNYEYQGKKLDESQIKAILLDFLKQRFFNRFVQNTDEHVFNSAIIINGEQVGMSAMYDYDFTLARRTTDVVPGCKWQGVENEMVLDNGKSDVASFIEQYARVPGMKEFIKQCIDSYSLQGLEQIILKNTGISIDREEVRKHYEIIENNMTKTIEEFNKIHSKEIGGDER